MKTLSRLAPLALVLAASSLVACGVDEYQDDDQNNDAPECSTSADCAEGQICDDGQCVLDDFGCATIYAPVCGVDGVTYGNACEADRAGVEVDHDGVCEGERCYSDQDCGDEQRCTVEEECLPDPNCPDCDVCTGRCVPDDTPAPDCLAGEACAPGEVCVETCRSSCPECDDCIPTGVCMPGEEPDCRPCDSDNDCGFADVCYFGVCTSVACPEVYSPVCGASGTTWSTPCDAVAAHDPIAYQGVCRPCDSDDDCADGVACVHDIITTPSCDPITTPGGQGVSYCAEPGSQACAADADCAPGEACFDGLCVGLACDAVYEPVCGVDGMTYGNACEAGLARVEVAYQGECQHDYCYSDQECGDGLRCTAEEECLNDPNCPDCDVCVGRCVPADPPPQGCMVDADCQRGQLCFEAVCEFAACPEIYAPVCGANGQTYANDCFARLDHVEVASEGECD